MNKLSIPPNQSGYAVTNGSGVKRTELDGGSGRYRRDILNQASLVNCSWTINRDDYDYLMAFFRINERDGGAGFLIDLILDNWQPTEYVAHVVPGSWGLGSQAGTGYTINAQLEVEPIQPDYEYDQSIIDSVEAFGGIREAIEAFNLLHKLVHHDLPNLYPDSDYQADVYEMLHEVIEDL